MGSRRKAREVALQFLYQLDLHGADDPDAARGGVLDAASGRHRRPSAFAEALVRGSKQQQGKIDQLIAQYAEHWDLERMAVVDRNILRMAVFELLWQPEVPPKAAINEAIEIAKKFGTTRVEPLHQRRARSDPARARPTSA